MEVVQPPIGDDEALTLEGALDYAREMGIAIVVTGEVTFDAGTVGHTEAIEKKGAI